MPVFVRFGGRDIYRPGCYSKIDVSTLNNLISGEAGTVIVVGEATAGEPLTAYAFSDPKSMIDAFVDGDLADAAQILFDPARAGQVIEGVEVAGASRVIAIKTNDSTQGALTLLDATSAAAMIVSGRIWGTEDGFTTIAVAAGTSGGKKITTVRTRAPLIGTETHDNIGQYAWFKCQRTNAGGATGAAVRYARATGNLILRKQTVGPVWTDEFTISCAGKTVADVIAEINTKTAWSAVTVNAAAGSKSAADLDNVAADSDSALSPDYSDMYGVLQDCVDTLNASSSHVEATRSALANGIAPPNTLSATYLVGGALGTTDGTDVDNALIEAAKYDARFVVSLFVTTTSGGTAIDTVNGKFATHASTLSGITGRAERQVFLAQHVTAKADAITAAQTLASEYAALSVTEVYREDAAGAKQWLGEWAAAAMCAGIAAATPIGTPLTFKYIKAYDLRYGWTWNPLTDPEDLIKTGVLVFESDPGQGIRLLKDVTTYTATDNDILRIVSGKEMHLWHKKMIRLNIEQYFVGVKGKGIVTDRAVESRMIELHRTLSDTSNPDFLFIASTADDGTVTPPFRNIVAQSSGAVIRVTGEVNYAPGIQFVLNELVAIPQA